MTKFAFSLRIEPFALDEDDVAEALYSRIDDALFGFSSGVASVEFAREAESLDEAIVSAIADIQAAGHGLRVSRVEIDESDRPASEQETRALAAVNAALELARWHGRPELVHPYLRPMVEPAEVRRGT